LSEHRARVEGPWGASREEREAAKTGIQVLLIPLPVSRGVTCSIADAEIGEVLILRAETTFAVSSTG